MTDVLAATVQPGWYNDPLSSERYRWWDGDTWTGKVATKYLEPADAVAPPVVTPTVDHAPEATIFAVETAPVEAEVIAPVTVAEPVVIEPVAAVVAEPAVAEPVVAEPVVAEPVVIETTVSAEFAAVEAELAELAAFEAGSTEPVVAAPVFAEPTFAEPVVDDGEELEPIEFLQAEPEAEHVEAGAAPMTAEQIAEFAAMPQFLPDADPDSPFADRWDDVPLVAAYQAPAVDEVDDDTAPKLDWAAFDRVVATAPEAAQDGLVEVLPSTRVTTEPAFAAEPVAAQPAPGAMQFTELLPPPAAPEAHVESSPVPAAAAPHPTTPADDDAPVDLSATSTVTPASIVLAVWPLLLAVTGVGAAALYLAPGMPAGVWAATAVVPLAIAIAGVIVDRQSLERLGAPRAGAGWIALTPLAYLVARARRLGAGARRRFLPVIVGAVSAVLLVGTVAAGAVFTVPDPAKLDEAAALLQSQLSTEDAPVIVDCDMVAVTVPTMPFSCMSYPVSGGAESVSAIIGFDGTVTAG